MCKPPGSGGTGLSAFRKPHSGLCSVPASPLIVKEERVVQGADGTERFHRNTCRNECTRQDFFPLFRLIFSFSKVSAFLSLFYGSWSDISVNKPQPRGQHLLEAVGRLPQLPHALAGGRDPRIEVERPLCWPDSSGKIQEQENLED